MLTSLPLNPLGGFLIISLIIVVVFSIPISVISIIIYGLNSYCKQRYNIDSDAAAAQRQQELIDVSRNVSPRIVASNGSVIINNSHGASVVNELDLRGAIISDYAKDSDLSDSLKVVAGFLASVKEDEAIRCFNEFNKKLSENDSKTTLRALWKQIVELVPDVVKLGEAAVKIGVFLGLSPV